MRATYPDESYIAQQGRGATRTEAELAALGAVSLYFETQSEVERTGRDSWTTQDGVTIGASRQVEQNILVRSQTRLVATRYAQDPWFDPALKEWVTVAYINRDEGWAIYEPQAKKAADTLLALYRMAEGDGDPFPRALRFSVAQSYSESAEFGAIEFFSQVLHPQKARSLFQDADNAASALPEKNYAARQGATVYIDCPQDLDGLIYQAAVSALGAEGFPVERNRGTASSICVIAVDEGEQRSDSGAIYNPILTGTISGKTGAVFSFSVKGERSGAINPDLAKRRAYQALSAAFAESFSGEFNKKRASFMQN
jgi:hypothetical protein